MKWGKGTKAYRDTKSIVATDLSEETAALLQNTASIPSYFVWNGMVAYKVNENYSIQMNITNITDETYYDNAYYTSASENHITPGAGRTFTFTARANF